MSLIEFGSPWAHVDPGRWRMRITGAGDYHVQVEPDLGERTRYGLVAPDGTFTVLLAGTSELARYEAFYLVMTTHAGRISLIEIED